MARTVGERASGFTLRDPEGHGRSLEEACAAGPVVLLFVRTTVPSCRDAALWLEALRGRAPANCTCWAVSLSSTPRSREWHTGLGLSCPVLVDLAGLASAALGLGPREVPAAFLLDRAFVVRAVAVGEGLAGREDLERSLAVLAGAAS
ncbi:MAG: redoxin domain-containing protein [Planctomycetes bacterium]|nr:redoxin domain-containing protein [Planctomycetota bacterium]